MDIYTVNLPAANESWSVIGPRSFNLGSEGQLVHRHTKVIIIIFFFQITAGNCTVKHQK